MKAAQINQYGNPEVFAIVDLPSPTPGDFDILVEVKAASVNPIDCKIRSGAQKLFIRYDLPWTLGLDVAGVVTQIGAKVTRFKVGDEVYSSLDYKRPGSYAEQVLIHEDLPGLKPAKLSFEEAAAVPLAALTVWQSLVTTGEMKAGDKVFIQAGAGGVGHLAIQVAKARGAFVATTCSTRNVEFVKSLGADQIIDYTSQNYEDEVRDFDIVLDSLGGEHRKRARNCLKKGGRHISLNSDIPQKVKEKGSILGTMSAVLGVGGFMVCSRLKGIQASLVVQRPNSEHLDEITKLIDADKVKVEVASTFSLTDITKAHEASETGRTRGKIVIAMTS